MSAPLEGLRVIELARILAGPWLGQTLADLGADVLKVEAPRGDDTRRWGPPFIESNGEQTAAYYHAANRGKRLSTCNFKDADQLAALKAEIAQADVLIENFKVGDLARYGLDYEGVAATNPGLVYVSITGFGQTGPKAALPGYDLLIQAACGIMDLTGEADGPPQKVGVAWVDILTGLYGVIGVQAALAERTRSGLGQHVDLSLMDCAVASMANQAQNALVTGQAPQRLGTAHPNIVPYQAFPAADGYVIIACGNDCQFKALCAALGVSQLGEDTRFLTNGDRVQHREELVDLLSARTTQLDRTMLVERLEAAGVPGGPINSMTDALADPQIAAREMIVETDGHQGLRTPIRFSRSQLALERGVPSLSNAPKING